MSVFFSSWKNIFKAISLTTRYISTPGLSIELFNFFLSQSRQLLDSSSIHWESLYLLDSCSIAPQSIKLVLLWKPLDNCSIVVSLHAFKARHLSTPLDLSRIMKSYIFVQRNFRFTSFRSLSIALVSSPPKTPLSHSKLHPHLIFGLDQVFLHW